jgi:hypothetical protein
MTGSFISHGLSQTEIADESMLQLYDANKVKLGLPVLILQPQYCALGSFLSSPIRRYTLACSQSAFRQIFRCPRSSQMLVHYSFHTSKPVSRKHFAITLQPQVFFHELLAPRATRTTESTYLQVPKWASVHGTFLGTIPPRMVKMHMSSDQRDGSKQVQKNWQGWRRLFTWCLGLVDSGVWGRTLRRSSSTKCSLKCSGGSIGA